MLTTAGGVVLGVVGLYLIPVMVCIAAVCIGAVSIALADDENWPED